VLTILQQANVALCFSDHADAPAPWEITARHIYVRGHGPSGRYYGTYPVRTLRRWADAALRWQSEQRKLYIYFDNDQKAAARKDAARLVDCQCRVRIAQLICPSRQATLHYQR
jgi:uncharacterized protein YecE (DUF72 family)